MSIFVIVSDPTEIRKNLVEIHEKNNDRGANKSLIIHKTSQNNWNNIIWSCIWVYLGKKSRRSMRLEILVKHSIIYSMSQIWRNHLICLAYQIYAKNVYIGLTMFQSLKFRCKRWFYMTSSIVVVDWLMSSSVKRLGRVTLMSWKLTWNVLIST